jgi:hypothetical protein
MTERVCSVPGCGRPHRAKGLCNAHWLRMPERGTCAVSGCGKGQRARGLCPNHWKRWRLHGNPLGGRTTRGDPRRFIDVAVDYDGTECLLWPYSVNRQGYGQVHYDGGFYRAHNLICRLVHGAPPGPNAHAAHGCGNRLCIAPQHLRWATPPQNNADKILHGTLRATLTADVVKCIRKRLADFSRELAAEYGISRSAIEYIRRVKSWRWLEKNVEEDRPEWEE